MTASTVRLCEIDALGDGDVKAIDIGGLVVMAARVGDSWYAIDDTCSHAKVSLSDGIIDEDDRTIECPKHGALFSLESGEALTLPATKDVRTHAVEVKEDGVYVTIGEEDA